MILRDLRHHRKPRARLTVGATDAAGSSSGVKRFWVDLVAR